MTTAAIQRNWQGFEPVTESRWNMTQEEQRSKAIGYMNQVEPDLVIVNLPPHPWEQASHRISRRTWPRRKKLLALREQQRQGFLKTAHEISKWCQQSGCICVGIGEQHSDVWQEPIVKDMFNAARVVCHGTEVAAPKDMCTQLHSAGILKNYWIGRTERSQVPEVHMQLTKKKQYQKNDSQIQMQNVHL